jgi:tRNA U34 5-methylaminomethyl-2-thiouridine-forming methyltransferase MnmC
VPQPAYRVVQLANGACCVRSLAFDETFHPGIGPAAEAEALYVRQVRLIERARQYAGEFVIWDVGLGAAANVLAVLRATREVPCALRLISFDFTLEPLEFALQHRESLGYFHGYESPLERLLREHCVSFQCGPQDVQWELRLSDFPTLLAQPGAKDLAKPHLVMFDACSPAKNPGMWTQPLFDNLFRLLDSNRPCTVASFSRSTMVRVTLLLAGFFVGVGRAIGDKEETTIATTTRGAIDELLDPHWLRRARRSSSAEPLRTPVYRQAPLSPETWEMLRNHPQFQSASALTSG